MIKVDLKPGVYVLSRDVVNPIGKERKKRGSSWVRSPSFAKGDAFLVVRALSAPDEPSALEIDVVEPDYWQWSERVLLAIDGELVKQHAHLPALLAIVPWLVPSDRTDHRLYASAKAAWVSVETLLASAAHELLEEGVLTVEQIASARERRVARLSAGEEEKEAMSAKKGSAP